MDDSEYDDEAGEGQPVELEQDAKRVPTIEIIGAYSYDESTDTHSLQGPREWTDPNPEERKFLHWKSGNRAGRTRLPCPVAHRQESEDIDKKSIKLEKIIVAAKKILELEMRNAHSQGLGIEVWSKTALASKPPGLIKLLYKNTNMKTT